MKEVFGFLNILKPPGMTSHDLVDEARRIFKIRRIGHGGTLDPGAAGVLPLALGKATRLFEFLNDATKVYRGEITFGASTSTHDAQGKLLEKKSAEALTVEKIQAILPKFIGDIKQIPPQVSAIRHQGKHSYEWERKGIAVPLEARSVRIENIAIKHFFQGTFPRVIVDVRSSSGMYMRSLARDMGDVLGTGAFLSFLVRMESSPFCIEESRTIEEVRQHVMAGEHEAVLMSAEKVFPHFPKFSISEQQKLLLLRGNRLPFDISVAENLVQLYDEDEDLIALGRVSSGKKPYYFQPVKLFD